MTIQTRRLLQLQVSGDSAYSRLIRRLQRRVRSGQAFMPDDYRAMLRLIWRYAR